MVMLAFIISGFVLIILKLCGINVKFINMIYAAIGAAIYTVVRLRFGIFYSF